jgi:hypothetical protein
MESLSRYIIWELGYGKWGMRRQETEAKMGNIEYRIPASVNPRYPLLNAATVPEIW